MSDTLDKVVSTVAFEIVHNFRGRSGYTLVARSTDAKGDPLFYELTKQYEHIGGPLEALAGFLRVQIVEMSEE